MMADGALKATAENKIKELEKDVQELRGELISQESFNSAAWAEYGSELCAGEMASSELKIRANITEAMGKIVLLLRFIEGGLDISREEKLKTNSVEVAAQIVTLQDSKELIDEELSEIIKVKNILTVKF